MVKEGLEPRFASLDRLAHRLTSDADNSANIIVGSGTTETVHAAHISTSNEAASYPGAASKFLQEARQQMLMSTYDAYPSSNVKLRDSSRELLLSEGDRRHALGMENDSSWDTHQRLEPTSSTWTSTSPSRTVPPPPPINQARDPFCEREPAPRHAAFSDPLPSPRPPQTSVAENTSPPFSSRDKMMLQTYCDNFAPVDKYYRGGFGGDGSMFVHDNGSFSGGSNCVKTVFFTPDAVTHRTAIPKSCRPVSDARELDFDAIEASFSTINDEDEASTKATIRQLENDVSSCTMNQPLVQKC